MLQTFSFRTDDQKQQSSTALATGSRTVLVNSNPREKMFSLTTAGVTIGLAFFLFRSSVCIMEEYAPLYLKQIGYSASFIGLAPILGLLTQTVGIPLFGYLADKFRARKLFLFLSVIISISSTLLFLAAPTPQPICDVATANSTGGNDTIAASLNRTDHSVGWFHNFTILPSALPSFSVNSSSPVQHTELHTQVPTKSQDENDGERLKFFIIFLILRGVFELSKRLTVTLITVAAVSHLKQDKSKFGYYACWGEIGSGLALFVVGISMYHIQHYVCGDLAPEYVIIFFYVVGFQILTLGTLPWMTFEYLEHRVMDYKEVKRVLTNPHYILILVICCHSGLCSAFQFRWEFWYMEKLGGGSIVMAVGGLLRRPIVAVWFLLSRLIIGRFGELRVIAFSLFISAASFAALAFTENAWLVILFDNFQAASYVLSFASFVIHFSKAGSKASTAFFQGAVSLTFHGIGKEVGTAVTGFLFTSVGTKITLCSYSVVTVVLLVIFLIYMFTGKDLEGYMRMPNTDTKDEDELEE